MKYLRAEAQEFDLSEADLTMRIGRASFLISSYNGDVPGVLVAENVIANQIIATQLGITDYESEAPTVSVIAPRGALLHLGQFMKIGRDLGGGRGVEFFDPDSTPDEEPRQLYNWSPIERILSVDPYASRYNTLVKSIGASGVLVMDVGGRNGTKVEPQLPNDP
jgi:hypothetical protein